MGKVYDIEKEKISEQSKKEICEACKEMAKTYLNFTEKQLKQFEKNFILLQTNMYLERKKKEWKFKRALAFNKCPLYNLLRK